jgi:phosphoesterase RecJ-like protein
MPVEAGLAQAFAGLIVNAQRVLVVSHIRPDGDAIGSLLGLGLSLQAAGKDVQMVSEDGVPASLRHLDPERQVRSRPEGAFDLICVVDCSDLERTGKTLRDLGQPHVNIDHHRTNLNFAQLNIVYDTAVATAEILFQLLLQLELPIPTPAAAALLTGLITDTIGFRTSNMTPTAMRMAAELMDRGLNLPELYQKALVNRSFEAVKLWANGLAKIEKEDRLVYTVLTLQDRQAAGYAGRDDADLINILSSIDGADVALILVEQPNKRVKVSWRAVPGVDVSQVALSFGGGGHAAASGAELMGDLSEVLPLVLDKTRPYLNGGHNVQSL